MSHLNAERPDKSTTAAICSKLTKWQYEKSSLSGLLGLKISGTHKSCQHRLPPLWFETILVATPANVQLPSRFSTSNTTPWIRVKYRKTDKIGCAAKRKVSLLLARGTKQTSATTGMRRLVGLISSIRSEKQASASPSTHGSSNDTSYDLFCAASIVHLACIGYYKFPLEAFLPS
jgi:hypothetical protein